MISRSALPALRAASVSRSAARPLARTFLTPPAARSFQSSSVASLWRPFSSPASGAAGTAQEGAAKAGETTVEGASDAAAEPKVEIKEDVRIKELEKKLEEASKLAAELKSSLTYSQADFQNLQRRSAEEVKKAQVFAIQKFAGDLLSTVDILTLALKHVPQPIPEDNAALKALSDGVDMTKTELLKALARHGVTVMEPMGEKFDPNLHEALYQMPAENKEVGTVCDVQQTGYMLKDRTLRAAQVGVVRAP